MLGSPASAAAEFNVELGVDTANADQRGSAG
jgi:hypothetical protein